MASSRASTPNSAGEIKRRFDDSPVTLVGLGSNECFDNPDPAVLAKAIEATKAFVKLGHDVGAGGVKVKPNSFHKDVPREKTIEQIGRSLNTVGKFAADYGQQIRLEVHGECSPPPVMKQIMDVADHPNVTICWNSNRADLEGQGLEAQLQSAEGPFRGDVPHSHAGRQGLPVPEAVGPDGQNGL